MRAARRPCPPIGAPSVRVSATGSAVYVLLAVVVLFLLDLYAKRVRMFGYRTIKY